MSEIQLLTLEIIENAMSGHAAAFRSVTEYQPAGGIGDKVFPPTYEGGKYAFEKRFTEAGEVLCVLLDSVQSQANRIEQALLEAQQNDRIKLPVLTVCFEQDLLKAHFKDKSLDGKKVVVTSLDAPHRVADAIFRDSRLDGVFFRKSEKGKLLDIAEVRNATGLFGLNPTSLVLGLWDSTGPRGGLGAKFQRALVSEMVGYHAQLGIATASRIDPLGIVRAAGPVFRTRDGGWTVDPKSAILSNGKPVLFGLSNKKQVTYDESKDQDQGSPSKINHGNVTPDYAYSKRNNRKTYYDANDIMVEFPCIKGGVTISHARQTTVLSLATLRRLRFPLNGNFNSAVDLAGRTALACLGLLGAVLAREEGADLRSRCQLYPTQNSVWELLDNPIEKQMKTFSVTADSAIELFNAAVIKAKGVGLPWEDEIVLTPGENLISLVAKSQELAMHQATEGDE